MPLGAVQNITALTRYSDDTIVVGPGACSPGEFEFWVSEMAFLAFWGYFWAKYKGLKSHFLTVYLVIFKKYFGENEIKRTSLHLPYLANKIYNMQYFGETFCLLSFYWQ